MKVEQKTVNSETRGTVSLVCPVGDIDMHESPKLRASLMSSMGSKPTSIVVDLSQVGFIDSSGVATLVEGLKTSKSAGIEFILCGMSPKVLDVFELSRLDKIFKILASTQEALQGVQGSK